MPNLMKKQGYRFAVHWIALNDSAMDGDDIEVVRGYLTVALVADAFGKDQDKVAADVMEARRKIQIEIARRQDLDILGSPTPNQQTLRVTMEQT